MFVQLLFSGQGLLAASHSFLSGGRLWRNIIFTTFINMHVLEMKKEGRKKQARLNKQQGKATQHTQGSHFSKGRNELPRVRLSCTCTLHLKTT